MQDLLVTNYIAEVVRCPPDVPYNQLPESARRIERCIRDTCGSSGLAGFRRAVLQRLAATFRRSPFYQSTEEISSLVERSLSRIHERSTDAGDEHYSRYEDLYLKDLGICRGIMFPAGVRVVQASAGVQRSIAFQGNISQRLEFLKLLMSLGGRRPVFQLHVHPDELGDFSATGWRRTQGRLARMLIENPSIRGVYGCSWFYDPNLSKTSPHLAYVHSLAAEAGARFFDLGVDPSGDALEKSRSRRMLAETGNYVPRSVAVIWPRTTMINNCAKW